MAAKRRRDQFGRPRRQQIAEGDGVTLTQSQIEIVQTQTHTGPLPHPTVLAQYQQIGVGDVILDEMRQNARHRRWLEKVLAIANAFAFVTTGLGAWLVDFGLVAGGVILIWQGKPIEGLIALAAELAVLRWGSRTVKK